VYQSDSQKASESHRSRLRRSGITETNSWVTGAVAGGIPGDASQTWLELSPKNSMIKVRLLKAMCSILHGVSNVSLNINNTEICIEYEELFYAWLLADPP
jgi:hypothetical protein